MSRTPALPPWSAARRRWLLAAAIAPAIAPLIGRAAAPDAAPLYGARLPAPAVLEYELRYGMLSGSGRLQWQWGDGAYALGLEGRALGLQILDWRSQGRTGSHGLAPLRFADKRLNRAEQVASFDRDAQLVRYAGPKVAAGTSAALKPGMQDRVSWLVQLPAVLEAEPALRRSGQQIAMFVTGARGNVDLWTFVVLGRQPVALPGGRNVDALAMRLVPDRPGDVASEAWLDPARGHLPVRARLASDSGTLELLLR